MKSHTAWFMGPIYDTKKGIVVASEVIADLGDFDHIRVPSKCAARIGQAFTDTTAWIPIKPAATAFTPDVIHPETKRVFSDGCGNISKQLLEQVWDLYPKLFMRVKPTVLQIRHGGSKGVVSLDPSLAEDMIVLRRSMWKFDAKDNDFEVCGMNNRPLPLYLNRPLIKLLEDLGVPEQSFISLQDEVIEDLQKAVSTPKAAAAYLEAEQFAEASGVPGLLRRMATIKINPFDDQFLSQIVDAAMAVTLRDAKYRGRIRIKQGVKLYGIMDETGYLKENQIFCVTESPQGGRRVLCDVDDPAGIRVAITRSPALHPGDLQVVYAVDVPKGSPLQQLTNVVVFSKHGERDLASKLSGGGKLNIETGLSI